MEPAPEWHAGRMLAVSSAYWQGAVLQAAVRLDLFSAIAAGTRTGPDLAAERGLDPDALGRLLDALCALGLLEKTSLSYRNTPAAQALLVRDSAEYIGSIRLHHHALAPSWHRLDQAVRSGGPVRPPSIDGEAADREHFLMGMFNLALLAAPRVVPHIDLSGRHRLLDLGGGPGTWALEFCRHNPGLRAVVADLPTTRPFAERVIARFGLQARVEFTPLDYHREEIAGRYDAVWVSQILHAEGPDICRRLLAKATAALEPGGRLMIHEFILDDTRDGPLFPALFSLNMLVRTEQGRSYSEDQLRTMMAEAGLEKIRRLPARTPNDSGVMVGTKRGGAANSPERS